MVKLLNELAFSHYGGKMRTESLSDGIDKIPDRIESFADVEGVKFIGDIDNVIVSGVDNSLIAGEMLKNYVDELGLKLPIFLNESVELPAWANSRTLVFIVSYSGSDLEAMKSYKTAVGRGCKILVISSDGKLKQMANENNTDFIKLPENIDSRGAFFLSLIAMINTLRKNNIIREDIDFFRIARVMRKDKFKEHAELLANNLVGKLPIIYTSNRFSSMGMLWKRFFNLNSKIIAFSNTIPEACYSDVEGYTTSPDNIHIIFLRDKEENKHVNREIDSMKSLLKGEKQVSELRISGTDYLTELFSTAYFGLLASVKLGELIENDVESTPNIDAIKKDLKGIY